MKRIDLAFPCSADFSRMPRTSGGRFCGECEKVVHDLSGMTEGDARALLESTPRERVCVRYVYDAATGQVVFGPAAQVRTRLVPEHALAARFKSRLAVAAAIAAPILVEACGGGPDAYDDSRAVPRVSQDAAVDGRAMDPDAGIGSDAGAKDD